MNVLRLLPMSSLQPGMRLAKKIYNDGGLILLSENVELTSSIIKRLGMLGLNYVYISDPLTEDVIIEEVISDETRNKALRDIQTNFRKMTNPMVKGFVYPYLGKSFQNVVENILDDISSREDAMIMMMNMNSLDEYLYRHSLNVCIYTILMGRTQGYSPSELTALGLGALLHDVGKVLVPQSILQKSGKLTNDEYEQVKHHAEYGYMMLKDEAGIPLSAAHCAYQHHERMNGSGYPRQLKGDDIHDYARWIAIADSYDAMTTHRVYRSALLPHQAAEILYVGCGQLYEKEKLDVFRDKVAVYPLGITVKINTGETGIVVKIHHHLPQRPILRIVTDPDGETLKAPYDLDLAITLTTVITEVEQLGTIGITV